MFFGMMVCTKGVTPVIPVAAVRGIGKHYIFAFVITNPLIAAFRFRQFLSFPAQPAPWAVLGSALFHWLGLYFSNHGHPFFVAHCCFRTQTVESI
jgi:hypothetical protein